MDSMTKMYISIIAIILMFVCNFMMVYARKQTGFFSFLLKTIAILLLPVVLLMIVVVLLF